MLEATDSEQLAYATAEKRAIVTFNVRDFAPLHEKYLEKNEEHWGIIFSTEEPIGVLTRRLLRLLNNISAQELKNQVRWLNEFQ